MTCRQIADDQNADYNLVRKAVKDAGFELKPGRNPKDFNAKETAKIVKMLGVVIKEANAAKKAKDEPKAKAPAKKAKDEPKAKAPAKKASKKPEPADDDEDDALLNTIPQDYDDEDDDDLDLDDEDDDDLDLDDEDDEDDE